MPQRTAVPVSPQAGEQLAEVPSRTPHVRPTVLVFAAVFAVAHVLFVAPSPVADGPRPPRPQPDVTTRWSFPPPHVDSRFATMPALGPNDEPGLWRLASSAQRLRFIVEQPVADRFGMDVIESAVEAWNDVPGSRFHATVDRVVDSGINARRRDGFHRIFLDRRTCGERYLARAHLWRGPLQVRDGRAVQTIREVDIGLCDRLQPAQLVSVMQHELAHAAGLDHLCNEDEACHRPGMAEDNTCRILSPRAHPCQQVTEGDRLGFAHLYPGVPRAGGGDARSVSATVARALHPNPWSALTVVATPYDADLELQIAGANLAAHRDAPHILIDQDCTAGADGQALHHTASLNATVLLVGPVPEGCARTLEDAWSLAVERVPDVHTAQDLALEAVGLPLRLVVTPAPEAGRVVPIAATALPVAVAMETIVMSVPEDGNVGRIVDVLEEHPSIREVVAVGDTDLLSTRTAADIAGTGVTVRRVPGRHAVDTSVTLARLGEFVGAGQLGAVMVAYDHPQHAIPAASLASSAGALLLPVEPEPWFAQVTMLRDRVDRGAIVGGPQGISVEQQLLLSLLVDGALAPAAAEGSSAQKPMERPMSSFMISVVPP